MIRRLLCTLGLHSWEEIGTMEIENYVVFGAPALTVVGLNRCRGCGLRDPLLEVVRAEEMRSGVVDPAHRKTEVCESSGSR